MKLVNGFRVALAAAHRAMVGELSKRLADRGPLADWDRSTTYLLEILSVKKKSLMGNSKGVLLALLPLF